MRWRSTATASARHVVSASRPCPTTGRHRATSRRNVGTRPTSRLHRPGDTRPTWPTRSTFVVTVGVDSSPDRVETVPVGSIVTMSIVNPDDDDEFHLHGYDLGDGAGVRRRARPRRSRSPPTRPGDFELESHETEDVLLILRRRDDAAAARAPGRLGRGPARRRPDRGRSSACCGSPSGTGRTRQQRRSRSRRRRQP